MNRKFLIISAMAVSLSLNVFSQNCLKFVDYQNKTINTNGINLRIFGQSVGVGATNVAPIMREASDKLQKLDLLQYNICEQLKNIKTDFMREKLQAQYTNLLMQMMQLQQMEGSGGGISPQPPTVAQNNTAVPNPSSEQQAEKEKKADEPPAPAPTPNPTPSPTPNPIFDDINMDVDISFPCEDFAVSPPGQIRAFGMETSIDAQIARRAARTAALEELASKVEITVKSVTADYFLRTQRGLDEELEKRIEGRTETSVNKTLQGYRTVCERTTQNRQTGRYSAYIALEISEDSVLRPVFDDLQQDPEIRNALPNYERFKQTFDEIMKELENSF